MSLTLYLLRHGQTAQSRDNVLCGARTDAHLTAQGREMAEAFATAYRKHPFVAVFCSPQRRARDTAEPLCSLLGRPAIIRDGLREIDYGEWEGRGTLELQKLYGDHYRNWVDDPVHCSPPGGETAPQILARVEPVINEIRGGYPSGDVLIVTHKAVIRILICSFLGIPLKDYRFRIACKVCSLSSVEFTERGPLLLTSGDTSHLPLHLRNLPGT